MGNLLDANNGSIETLKLWSEFRKVRTEWSDKVDQFLHLCWREAPASLLLLLSNGIHSKAEDPKYLGL